MSSFICFQCSSTKQHVPVVVLLHIEWPWALATRSPFHARVIMASRDRNELSLQIVNQVATTWAPMWNDLERLDLKMHLLNVNCHVHDRSVHVLGNICASSVVASSILLYEALWSHSVTAASSWNDSKWKWIFVVQALPPLFSQSTCCNDTGVSTASNKKWCSCCAETFQ